MLLVRNHQTSQEDAKLTRSESQKILDSVPFGANEWIFSDFWLILEIFSVLFGRCADLNNSTDNLVKRLPAKATVLENGTVTQHF